MHLWAQGRERRTAVPAKGAVVTSRVDGVAQGVTEGAAVRPASSNTRWYGHLVVLRRRSAESSREREREGDDGL